MEIKNNINSASKIGFKGYEHKKTNEGSPSYEFNFPYDPKYWNCEVEFYHVKKSDYDYSYSIEKKDGKMEPFKVINITPDRNKMEETKDWTPKGVKVDISEELGLKDSEPVAYRYKLTHKYGAFDPKYAKDDDASTCGDGCNIIMRKGTSVIKQGPMYLGVPDSFNTQYVYAGFNEQDTGKIKKRTDKKGNQPFSRTFSNKAGGTLAGLEQKVPELREIGYKKIITTPITGGDNRSSHKYWIKKMMQPTSSLGNIDNFDSFQETLFKNGMGYVMDGAYTSQGIEGVNFKHAVKWMNQEDKPHEYYMFRMQGLEDAALKLGVVPKNMENLRHKVVNSPFEYKQQPDGQIKISENKDYDPTQSTYIQVYDDSLVSDEQKHDTKNLIVDYAKDAPTGKNKDGKDVKNNIAINTHDDTVVNNAFPIDPYEYNANIVTLNDINKNRPISDKIKLDNPVATLMVGKMSGFEVAPKDEGGYVAWDSNADLAKLSYTESDYDTQLLDSIKNPKERAIEEQKFARAHSGNRDMLASTMRYWTKHVRNVHTELTARTLGKLTDDTDKIEDRMNSLIYNRNNRQLPEDVELSKDVIANVKNNDHILREKESDTNIALDKALMDLPLDSIEFEDETVGALSSPYLSKRSPDFDKQHILESRYDAMNDETYEVPEKYAKTYNKMNSVFTKEIHNFAMDVLKEVDKNSTEKLFEEDSSELTEYGQYVVPMVAGDIAKYAIIKSLVPNAKTKQLDNGKLTYDYEKLEKEATLASMGINGDSEEDEANQIVNKIQKGVAKFDSSNVKTMADSISKRIKDTNTLSFRFAEVMVDRSGLGLDWRIDAAKDVADMDAIRSKQDTSDNQFAEVINIWSPAVDAIKEENPNSLVLAEFTDLYGTMQASYGDGEYANSRFKSGNNISRILLDETGMNTEANYDYFFTAGINTFGKDFVVDNVYGFDNGNKNIEESDRIGLLSNALGRFSQRSLDYKRNSYTFGGNHDKPRLAEGFSIDMALAHGNLNDTEEVKKGDTVIASKERVINNRKIAYKIMNDVLFDKDLEKPNDKYFGKTGWDIINGDKDYFNNVSPMAIAKANLLRASIGLANAKLTKDRLSAPDLTEQQKEAIQQDSNNIYSAYSKAIADVVNGNFYLNGENENTNKSKTDSYKKQLEKDGFGAKDFVTAFDVITQQAIEKHNLQNTYLNDEGFKKEFNHMVQKVGLGIPATKIRMYSQMLAAIPGNPTVYAGDDLAQSGYEEKNHNLWLGNRAEQDFKEVEGAHEYEAIKNDKELNEDDKKQKLEAFKKSHPDYNEFLGAHKVAMDNIVGARRDYDNPKLAPLNEGTPYILNTMTGVNTDDRSKNYMKCPALFAQSGNGSMAVSVFNFNGISLENPIFNDNFKVEDIDKHLNPEFSPVELKYIALDTSNNGSNIELPEGVVFKNVEGTDKSQYVTRHRDGKCVLVREENIEKDDTKEPKWNETPVFVTKQTAPEGVLKLYHQPKSVEIENERKEKLYNQYSVSFKGSNKSREYFNNQYNIPNSYNTY